MSAFSRRDFLKLARNGFLYLSGALALGGLLRFLDYEANPAPKTDFDLGPASNYPLHSHTLLPEVPAILLHDENGFAALSLLCTHLGCTLRTEAGGFACPCHGSRFDLEGKVTHGPATEPLLPLRVKITEDKHLTLFTAA